MNREALGKIVRDAWVEWAKAQINPKPSWLVAWEELSETDREADRCIGEAVQGAIQEDEVRALSEQKLVIGGRVRVVINAEAVALSGDGQWVQILYAGYTFWVPLDVFCVPVPE